MQYLKLVLFLALLVVPEPAPAWKADTVKVWARLLGDEIWKLSEALTKSDQIRIKYKQMNASVKKKDGKQILESSLRSVSTMLTQKIKAVKCIHATAEELARTFNYSGTDERDPFQYCSAKYSDFFYKDSDDANTEDEDSDEPASGPVPDFAKNKTNYMEVVLERDSHFYDINVNTNTSCVHVPTNIFYKEKDALNDILWSKGLNEVFTKNYKSDPSLSWQYFGSSHGILRFYPGMPWNKKEIDTYDCRVKSWYIEAATCSKDVIILFDVSGSMTGFKNYVARRTLKSLLETLSNNDYVNVYTYKSKVSRAVGCFESLVQATPENLETLIDALEPVEDKNRKIKHKVSLEGMANLTTAYIEAFSVLRARRGHCNVNSTQGCNQLVMVITDYVPGNLTEVFEEHNREVVDNKTYTPVRVFTYLIGKEVTNVKEILWMACLNRGYFVHIHSVEEVQQQVLKYINVIARPMILEKKEPPPTWTHANIDSTRTSKWGVSKLEKDTPDEDKLVTSVAIPAFDYYYNEHNNDAKLLGVAGTDVPIDSIAKLAKPHQLGVNGYSFIVSNNGYLLLHPLLITTINGKLRENYNSVDFVEVEQVDDGKKSREYGEEITALRESLVNGDDGYLMNVKVLYHYDNMRRITRVRHDYYYNKLEGTPFSMGISLPMRYGDTELLLKDNPLEAQQGKDLTGINVTDYFRYSYRIHPDWVYCKYHYLEGHESENFEVEIWKFLVGLSKNEIDITKEQYVNDMKNTTFNATENCGAGETGTEDYYCTEDLVKQLVFDAKLSNPYFQTWNATDQEWEKAKEYNVTVRFIATSSGLTRWHYIFDTDKNEVVDDFGTRTKKYEGDVFGDIYHNAIEETWYKAAVLQHMINKDSLVIATKLPILDEIIETPSPVIEEDGDITITASYAIFYKDGNSSTPASVVGFQYSYLAFYKRFLNITNITLGGNEAPTCNPDSDKYECYVIDSSGYIVLSRDISQVGRFFGTVQEYVLQSFLEKHIFDHVEVFNYQALCSKYLLKAKEGSSWTLQTPFRITFNFLQWLFTEMLLTLFNWNYSYGAPMDDNDYSDTTFPSRTEAPTTQSPPANKTNEKEDEPFSCDHSITLYILNQTYFLDAMGASPTVSEDTAGDCHPAYWAAYITKTNLLLVVVETDHRDFKALNCATPPNTKPQPTETSTSLREPCHKLELAGLHRRRLEDCYTYHDEERNITACGRGSMARGDIVVFLTALALAIAMGRGS